MTCLLGIYREPECSPGRHRSNDALLLETIAASLRGRGVSVELTDIDRAARRRPAAALIFSMCQGRPALDLLARWERDGAEIVNSPRAALNTYRDRLPALVGAAGVRFPATRLTDTSPGSADLPLAFELTRGVWLKRGDLHASVSADVQRVGSRDELAAGLANFRARGIARAALQEHRNGAEVKFYGVAGGAFFHWFFTNGSNDRAPDAAALQHLAEAAAAAAGLDVFGGDVIVEPSGELTLIDLNDWPSFAPCREAASRAIADYLMRRVHAVWKPGLVPSANQSAV